MSCFEILCILFVWRIILYINKNHSDCHAPFLFPCANNNFHHLLLCLRLVTHTGNAISINKLHVAYLSAELSAPACKLSILNYVKTNIPTIIDVAHLYV